MCWIIFGIKQTRRKKLSRSFCFLFETVISYSRLYTLLNSSWCEFTLSCNELSANTRYNPALGFLNPLVLQRPGSGGCILAPHSGPLSPSYPLLFSFFIHPLPRSYCNSVFVHCVYSISFLFWRRCGNSGDILTIINHIDNNINKKQPLLLRTHSSRLSGRAPFRRRTTQLIIASSSLSHSWPSVESHFLLSHRSSSLSLSLRSLAPSFLSSLFVSLELLRKPFFFLLCVIIAASDVCLMNI